jgi:hypothetical protein
VTTEARSKPAELVKTTFRGLLWLWPPCVMMLVLAGVWVVHWDGEHRDLSGQPLRSESESPFKLKEAEAWLLARLPAGSVQTAPADPLCNAHGWTFAHGRGHVDWETVEEMLRTQDWHKTAEPSPGDVVVYYEADGRLKHSGVVHSRREDGQILVESKWGPLGRYVHTSDIDGPQTQCVFYRIGAATIME